MPGSGLAPNALEFDESHRMWAWTIVFPRMWVLSNAIIVMHQTWQWTYMGSKKQPFVSSGHGSAVALSPAFYAR